MAYPKLHFRRIQSVETTDLPRAPRALRAAVTDAISFIALLFRSYAAAVPLLQRALKETGDTHVTDLCAGSGAPADFVRRRLKTESDLSIAVTLTDKYPDAAALTRVAEASGGAVVAELTPVDAALVPERLDGFRTMFTAFHHFPPKRAKQILADAARRRRGIAVFEYTDRNLLRWIFPTLMTPATLLFITPFIRPFSWTRLFWTYVLPVIPLAVTWDCLISGLRTYLPEELVAMAKESGEEEMRWETGVKNGVTYLIGLPLKPPPRG